MKTPKQRQQNQPTNKQTQTDKQTEEQINKQSGKKKKRIGWYISDGKRGDGDLSAFSLELNDSWPLSTTFQHFQFQFQEWILGRFSARILMKIIEESLLKIPSRFQRTRYFQYIFITFSATLRYV